MNQAQKIHTPTNPSHARSQQYLPAGALMRLDPREAYGKDLDEMIKTRMVSNVL